MQDIDCKRTVDLAPALGDIDDQLYMYTGVVGRITGQYRQGEDGDVVITPGGRRYWGVGTCVRVWGVDWGGVGVGGMGWGGV